MAKLGDYLYMAQIRQANIEDVERLCQLDHIARGYKNRVAFIGRAVKDQNCWVMEVDKQVVGYSVLEYNFFECGFISMLYFSEDYRRKGLGLQMMSHLESICTTKKLFSSTNKSNLPAQHLLEKVGFIRSGIIENLDKDDPELIYFKLIR